MWPGTLDEVKAREVLQKVLGTSEHDLHDRHLLDDWHQLRQHQLRSLAPASASDGHWATIRRGVNTVRAWGQAVRETRDTESSNTISKATFLRWFENKCTEAVDNSSLDVLYGTTRPGVYYWFVQVLWLKTAVNLLYVYGRASSLVWCGCHLVGSLNSAQ